jgi:predicted AAA+ superfamily ATPase
MVGFLLPPYHSSLRQRQRAKAKFYYFDLGVQRALAGLIEFAVAEGSVDYGNAFEHFVVAEFHRLIRYFKPDWKLSYIRTSDDAEIDLVIERPREKLVLIEIKSTKKIDLLDRQKLLGFKRLSSEIKDSETFLISRDPRRIKESHVEFIPWTDIFSRIGLRN